MMIRHTTQNRSDAVYERVADCRNIIMTVRRSGECLIPQNQTMANYLDVSSSPLQDRPI